MFLTPPAHFLTSSHTILIAEFGGQQPTDATIVFDPSDPSDLLTPRTSGEDMGLTLAAIHSPGDQQKFTAVSGGRGP